MRINIVKSKNAEQVYVIHSFRKNGKNTTKIYKKLGTIQQLSDKLNMSRSVSMSPSALCMYISWNVICSFGPRRALNLREISTNRELPVRQTLHLLHHQIDVMPVTLFTLRGIG